MKLPSVEGLVVGYDTEGSGLHVDDGARPSAVSCAWRDPSTSRIVSFAVPFDQGYDFATLPLGPKSIPSSHLKRISKWSPEHLRAPNRTPKVWDYLHRWLLRQHLVMHHGKHDLLQAAEGLRDHPDTGVDLSQRLLADTMLTAGVLWPRDSVALKRLAVQHHWGAELDIAEGAEADEQEALGPWKGPDADPRFDLIPWSVLEAYSRQDAELTLIAYEQEQLLLEQAGPSQRTCVSDDLRLARLLFRMERKGVGLDADGMSRESVKLAAKVAEAGLKVPFKGGTGRPTPPAAVKYFFGPEPEGLGLIPFSDKMTKGGATRGPQPQVDEEVISRLIRLDVPGAAEYAAYAELKAANEKWYMPWPAMTNPMDSRIRTVHKQGTVVSGRLAVERWQAQAMPHDYQIPEGILPPRWFLVADDGYQTWEADASQAEIRVATCIAKEKNMLRALRLGVDSHDAACKLMFFQGTSLADAKQLPIWEQRRQVAKRCNLGILYGIGARELRTQIAKFTGIEYAVDQCRDWISDWKNAFPGFARALYDYADLATNQGFVRLSTGRVRRFSDYEPVHKAFNQRIQGEVAEAAKRVMLRFDARYPGMLLLQIHDSIVAEIELALVEEVTQAMREIMIQVFSQMYAPVPFKADVKPFGRSGYKQPPVTESVEAAA